MDALSFLVGVVIGVLGVFGLVPFANWVKETYLKLSRKQVE